MTRPLKFWRAINEALSEELEADPAVLVAGVDAGAYGGPFGATRGLQERFGRDRVLDTPISEGTLAGLGVGAALSGLRPVIEIMFLDFITLASEQLVNQGAKARYMFGGRVSVPLVVRSALSAHMATSAQHSSSYEAWLCHAPGLKVVMPSNSYDAKGLLKAAIRDDNPTVVIEPLKLWGLVAEVPDGEWICPLGEASVIRSGTDATVVTFGAAVPRALEAATMLETEGISAEVVDLRTLSPLDWETTLQSAARTRNLVVVHDAVGPFGIGAEIIARAAEEGVLHNRRPRRVTPPFAPVPFSPLLEEKYYPNAHRIAAEIRGAVEGGKDD